MAPPSGASRGEEGGEEDPSQLVLQAQDFITRAFVEALASHQRHHGLQPRIQLAQGTPALAESLGASEQRQPASAAAAERAAGAASTNQQQQRQQRGSSKKAGRKAADGDAWGQSGAAADVQCGWEADPSYHAFWEWYSGGGYHSWTPPQPWWQQERQQQQQQQQQGWGGYWQQQSAPPPPLPPPPPPPPAPPVFGFGAWGGPCPSCGTGANADESVTAFLGARPSDIESDPASKSAADAAESHALRLTGGNRRAAGLMMAWFYAGYGAARAACAGGCSSGGSGGAAAAAAAGAVR